MGYVKQPTKRTYRIDILIYLYLSIGYFSSYTCGACEISLRRYKDLQFNAGCEWQNREILLGKNTTAGLPFSYERKRLNN